jgi:hypothetical protein
MKKLFAIAALVLVFVLVLQLVSFACDPPPPCPPPADCSPGFWKNHTELWFGDYDPVVAQSMLDALRAKGNSDLRPLRQPTADMLNAAYPDAPCDD